MTKSELKWFLVPRIGTQINKYKIMKDLNLFRKLQREFSTNDSTVILENLYSMGFKEVEMTKQEIETLNRREYNGFYAQYTHGYEKTKKQYRYEKYKKQNNLQKTC